jgi:hypothetical protein
MKNAASDIAGILPCAASEHSSSLVTITTFWSLFRGTPLWSRIASSEDKMMSTIDLVSEIHDRTFCDKFPGLCDVSCFFEQFALRCFLFGFGLPDSSRGSRGHPHHLSVFILFNKDKLSVRVGHDCNREFSVATVPDEMGFANLTFV